MLDTSVHYAGFSMRELRLHENLYRERTNMGILKIISVCVFAAVALGFFASIGIWAAVSFLRLFGIETL